ncbi:MAG: DUF3060 domain-containing protein [Deltaproteobacteria bacterium]|nr:DUF3060 domain-containing protein [Deltaproteobacteria bacterium]
MISKKLILTLATTFTLSSAIAAAQGAGTITIKKGDKTVEVKGAEAGAAAEAGKAAEAAKKIDISGVNKKLTLACEAGAKVSVAGTGHTITLTGDCDDLDLSGTNNTVVIDAAAKINVSGVGNKVTWTRGLSGKDPKISTSGVNNKVMRAEKK